MDELKLKALEAEFNSIEAKLGDPGVVPSQPDYLALSKRHAALRPLVAKIRERTRLIGELAALQGVVSGADAELRAMAEAEQGELQARLQAVEGEVEEALLGKDEREERSAFLEIRAGAGGDEASLFAAELARMYARFAQARGWKVDTLDSSSTGLKGVKQATLYIQGGGAYGWFRFEGGVHRVQRVPVTEASGRIHTSTCTVAVLPETAENFEVKIEDKDLRVDTFRAGGHGGQNVNKVESAIRITHLPTGIVVQCQEERSQGQNRMKAMMVLRAKLAQREEESRTRALDQDRRTQVGTGERAEKIRTYNFSQNRITDHRLESSWHNLAEVLDGSLEPVLEALRKWERKARLRGAGG